MGVQCEAISFDFANDTDYSRLLTKFDQVAMVVNNVGFIDINKVLEMKPKDMSTMLKVNHRPVTLLTKHAINRHVKGDSKGLGLVQVSSFSALRWYSTAGLYGGTKIYDRLFGFMID